MDTTKSNKDGGKTLTSVINPGAVIDMMTLTAVEEDDETTTLFFPDDLQEMPLTAKQKQISALQEQSFGNSMLQQSLTNSMLRSYQNSTIQSQQYSQSIQNTQSQSLLTTQSIQNMQNARRTSYQNTQSSKSMQISSGSIYPQYGSLLNTQQEKERKKKNKWLDSIRGLRHASISISMLAKPSEDRNANSLLTGWNVSNLIQGTTILGIPYAVQQGGWAAVIMIFFLGYMTCYTGKILVDCMYETSRKTNIRRRLRIDYPEIAQAALGRKGYIAMNIIQNSVMFGGSVMYIIILGTVWSNIVPQLGLKEWAAINCCVTLPTLFITKMSIVSWFSMVSVFSIMSCFLVLITYSLTQIPLLLLDNIPTFDVQTFPVGFGIIMFSYCAHAVLPSIEGSMKKPQSYDKMVNTSFLLATVSKAALGVLMVMRFGDKTAEVITVNLHGDGIFSQIASYLVIFNVLLAMPLEMFVVSASFDEAMLKYVPKLDKKSGKYWIWLLISRPLLLGACLLVAVTVPHFGLLMGMVGSFSGTALCFLFPCICHLKLRWNVLTRWQISLDFIIIVFGILAGFLGLCFSIKGLICADGK